VEALRQHNHDLEAFLVLAHSLPKREAIWWGCLCAWNRHRPTLDGAEDTALAAVVRWVQEPNEEHRRAAGKAGEAAGLTTLAGGLAMAAFWSGGSMAPPRLPTVLPPPTLTSVVIARVLFAAGAALDDGARRKQTHDFFEIGFQVAGGKHHWTDPALAVV
jgi:hypothetical protein